jgi:hypothetical protein
MDSLLEQRIHIYYDITGLFLARNFRNMAMFDQSEGATERGGDAPVNTVLHILPW